MIDISVLQAGSVIKLKKPHPCGGFEWQVINLGMDCRLRCLTCGRQVLLSRNDLQKRIKMIISQ
jgi:hypothetical protein